MELLTLKSGRLSKRLTLISVISSMITRFRMVLCGNGGYLLKQSEVDKLF